MGYGFHMTYEFRCVARCRPDTGYAMYHKANHFRMPKKILTIGFELASDDTQYEEFNSKISLLDWDIVLFRPQISEFISYRDTYQGRPRLNDTSSFRLKECCGHWRREIKQAVEAGKTVLVFLPPVEDVYIDTGERQYSGTGRNQKITHIVAPYTNYAAIPVELKPVNATGSAMKLASLGAEVLAPYWAEFGSNSEYKVLLNQEIAGISLTTKNGDKPVGAIARSKSSLGTLVLLPDIDFYPDAFLKEKAGEQIWTATAHQFATRFLGAVVALGRALRSSAEVTPEPGWSTNPDYILAPERTLRSELLDAERRVEEAHRTLEALQERLNMAGRTRALLYEKGPQLEHAIIEGLRTLGFTASSYKDADSEFDVVFECAEGRLLGEAEGKDTKAVNVDKLRQLAMNLHEDLVREEVTMPAKGVLFGNGYRLKPPSERELQFTEKCIAAARSSLTALLSTSDLFVAVQYLSEQFDDEYAKLCRKAILDGVGIVALPVPPTTPTESVPSSANADNLPRQRREKWCP